jgi:hypothetical protein
MIIPPPKVAGLPAREHRGLAGFRRVSVLVWIERDGAMSETRNIAAITLADVV